MNLGLCTRKRSESPTGAVPVLGKQDMGNGTTEHPSVLFMSFMLFPHLHSLR